MKTFLLTISVLILNSAAAEVHTILPPDQQGPLVVENRPGKIPLYVSGTMAFDCEKPQRGFNDGELPTPMDLARDVFCAQELIQRVAPNGFVMIMGSARESADINFELTREFASKWTKSALGTKFPIATGGGSGMMRAGNQGAFEAGGRSIGLIAKFGESGIEKSLNKFVTKDANSRLDAFMFASFSQREAEMIDRAAAIVVTSGGVGTAWELFESISKVQTGKKLLNGKKLTPIVFLGTKTECRLTRAILRNMVKMKTVSQSDVDLVKFVWDADSAVKIIDEVLSLN